MTAPSKPLALGEAGTELGQLKIRLRDKRRQQWCADQDRAADTIEALQAQLAAAEERAEKAERHLWAVADVVEPHWRGAGLPLESAWIIDEYCDVGRLLSDANDRADALSAKLEETQKALPSRIAAFLGEHGWVLSEDDSPRIAEIYLGGRWHQINVTEFARAIALPE